MSDTKRRYTSDGVEINTFQPQLPSGAAKPDPMKPPPFAGTKPRPAGQNLGSSQTANKTGKKA
jgi:hypothetical protein